MSEQILTERIARIMEEQHVGQAVARRAAIAECNLERALRDKKTSALAHAMREAAK